MASVLTEVIIDCKEPLRVAQFWRDVLAWPLVEDARGYCWLSATGEPTAPPLLVFVPVPEPKTLKNRSCEPWQPAKPQSRSRMG